MAMTKCKECGEKVSTSAKKCPHCGVDYPGTSAGDVIGGLVVLALIVGAVWWFMSDGDKEEAKSYSYSSASYEEVDSQVGCNSKYSDDKKDDIFNSKYKNKWMTWRGEVVLAEADEASLNIDGKGTQDLSVDFANKSAGYNLKKGDVISVKFVMKYAGGCFLPFSGDNASITR